MLNRIIRFSLRHKLLIGLLTVALIIWGSYSITNLPIDAVPDITNNQVQIITVAPSQAAIDIERLVTFPVEQTMATIPGIEEMRSFSRFGLSVVTIVFKDNIDIYWGRQQVNERLAEVKMQIPDGVGSPSLAPVTTGLGEIYQYIIRPKKGYEDKYTLTDLRTIQDWIIRRQLIGVPGVADVSSFGGSLKQYEVAVDPDRLRSYNLSIADLFTALEKNNQNTGGAYIDKQPNSWFIRSEGLINSLDDIENIVIKNTTEGIPVLVKNVATVGFGAAIRYGAMTYKNEGEVAGAITLMLKGANSNAVVKDIKLRMKQIEKTLPEGVEIYPYLDRSELVDRTIRTVQTNLIEGALIVIFVLVLFLGNLRAGLIVASVIPLSMLFAVSMMQAFGVSGNLMSLGAIDFGLIVDGAVIIVEATMHHLGLRKNTNRLTQVEMDDEVYESSSKILNAAVFGEIIILIVYLPILALSGVEGKMFTPMAQTVSFAIIGAFLLSLTYVPVASSLLMDKNPIHKKNFSDKMIEFFQRVYAKVIRWVMNRKAVVVTTALVLFIVSLILFTRMGGEFLPTLDEGDFAVETRLLTGSSLSQTVEVSGRSAEVLMKEFPDEIKEIVGKIGTSEIPIDPMPVEFCDMIVVLKPRKEWTKAKNKNELAEKMSEKLQAIPGVSFGFLQPIQMRFNELMTGVRQDVAVKIFGEDLEVLSDLATRVARVAGTVNGVRDIYKEEITGLPQIVVNINRQEVAKYGLSIEAINQTINTAFAGQVAGIVYEGERRFDLVLRLDKKNREQLDDVRNLYITTPTNNQVPLHQIASVDFKTGPNQIQREDAKRRIFVGFNVRDRDVASVVKELEQKINASVKMPTGYFVAFGGQFENLKQANQRLSIAVPAALLLIFLLLYFAFHSIKYAILIFFAIPMSAIGGVFALLMRDIPFSISAGVGFIALFGVAVLNGIVLIAEFNRLKKEGITDLYKIVFMGTQTRLRPVLMTASVASLGFLPMALATSAGAEVQRPLATVVIGGLVTSTLLTLIVLPCLYIYFERIKPFSFKHSKKLMTVLLCCFSIPAFSQVTVDKAIEEARKNNRLVKVADMEKDYETFIRSSAGYIGKTEFNLMVGQYNSYKAGDNNISISQRIPNPRTFSSLRSLGDEMIKSAEIRRNMTTNELAYRIKQVYFELLYLHARRKLLIEQDSIFSGFLKSASLRYETGETNLLEKTTAEASLNEVRNFLNQNDADIKANYFVLRQLAANESITIVVDDTLTEKNISRVHDSLSIESNPEWQLMKQHIEVINKEKDVIAAQRLPDFTIGYFNQTLIGNPLDETSTKLATSGNRFMGVNAGVAISIFNRPYRSRIKAAEINSQIASDRFLYNNTIMQSQWSKLMEEYKKNKMSVDYYRSSALPNADLLLKQAKLGYREGETSYAEYLLAIKSALDIKENYLQNLALLNQVVINLEFLSGIE